MITLKYPFGKKGVRHTSWSKVHTVSTCLEVVFLPVIRNEYTDRLFPDATPDVKIQEYSWNLICRKDRNTQS